MLEVLRAPDGSGPLFRQAPHSRGRLAAWLATISALQPLSNPFRSPAVPCRRVTPQGRPPVEAPSATKAWHGLFAQDATASSRLLGVSGEGGWEP